MYFPARTQSVTVNTGSGGEDGVLVFVEDQLVAVLVEIIDRQDAGDEPSRPWFLEAGFGPCRDWNKGQTFRSQDEAIAWVVDKISQDEVAFA
ncbi:hypothetical protein [Methylobacterium sp. ID0610]|uniref:hypothetical protein n=1 Tax=Methylobacterium carpenticola TaxID=3344827 RepID=UPI00367C3D2F